MIYLLETNLPETKPIVVSLKKIYGIGNFRAHLICKKLGFSKCLTLKDLSVNQRFRIIKLIEALNCCITSDLRKFRTSIFKKLEFIRSYKGLRRAQGLPVKGQRTRINPKSSKPSKSCICLLYFCHFLVLLVLVYSVGI
jgi:small subunit ribosomal protein S13